jgi:hypothetical protein
LALSVIGSTHDVPHSNCPRAHVAWHVPDEHTCPAAHAVPHVPQFIGSEDGSTHALPQSVPVAHPQRPAMHAVPGAQPVPQAPQFDASLCKSTHAPLQFV